MQFKRVCLGHTGIILILGLATVVKLIIVGTFYQHIGTNVDGKIDLTSAYGWAQLVSNMRSGNYVMTMQTGLSDIYDLRSKAYRPPLYPVMLYLCTLNRHGIWLILVLQSIITSAVAYMCYMLVRMRGVDIGAAILCLAVIFLTPMNFLKSGSLDEAPLMLLFLLLGLVFVSKAYYENRSSYVACAGAFFGLATLTRFNAHVLVLGLITYLLCSRKLKLKAVLYMLCVYVLFLSPWIIRNWAVYDRFVLSTGGSRLLLLAQSEEFLEMFPRVSIDEIERAYLRRLHGRRPSISQLKDIDLDSEFSKMFVGEMIRYPGKFVRSLIVRAKVFSPFGYFPEEEERRLKSLIYSLQYGIALMFLLMGLVWQRGFSIERNLLLVSISCYFCFGLLLLMMSRHMYPVIVMMITYFFCGMNGNRVRSADL